MEILISKRMAEKLEGELCVKFGFCSMREKYDKIIDNLPADLNEIVNAIFVAEGLNPDHADRHLRRRIRDIVIKAHHDSL